MNVFCFLLTFYIECRHMSGDDMEMILRLVLLVCPLYGPSFSSPFRSEDRIAALPSTYQFD